MTTRVLPPEEWHRLNGTALGALLSLMRADDVRVVVVEDEGCIVAHTSVMRMPCIEGTWIDSERKHAARSLLRGAYEAAKDWAAETWIFGGAADERMHGILKRIGGQAMPTTFYALSMEALQCRQR